MHQKEAKLRSMDRCIDNIIYKQNKIRSEIYTEEAELKLKKREFLIKEEE